MSANYVKKEFLNATISQTVTSDVIELDGCDVATLQVTHGANAAAVVVPSADINITANTFTKTSHGLITGTVGQFTTDDTLPTGISAVTNYFIIYVDANTFKVATSLVNANAGTAVDITNAGAGNQTFTPTALNFSVQPQVTNTPDPAAGDWINKGSAISISGSAATTSVEYDRKEVAYSKFRVVTTATAGQALMKIYGNFKV